MPINSSYFPGSVHIENIALTNYDKSSTKDIRNITVEINIYEDIWQSQVMGDIFIRDENEWIQTFPIIGEETLEIEFSVPTKDTIYSLKNLRVYRIGDRVTPGGNAGKVQGYRLYFISPEVLKSFNTSVPRSFNSQSVDKIVKTVFDEYIETDKKIDIESTEGNIKVVFPNWNPIKVINWLAGHRAMNKKTNADFVFYESHVKNEGLKYNFKSLSTLLEQKPTFTLVFKTQNLTDTRSKDMRDVSSQHQNIDSFTFDKHGNVLKNSMKGQYNQTWIYHDPLRKKFVVTKYNHDDDFLKNTSNTNTEKTVGGNKFYSDTIKNESQPLAFIRMPGGINSFPRDISPSKTLNNDKTKGHEDKPLRKMEEYISSHEKTDELETNSMIPDHAYKRVFKFQQMNNFRLCIDDFPGNDEIQLGKTIKFDKPHVAHDNKRFSDKMGRFDDMYVSGTYLVTRLKHRIVYSPTRHDHLYTQSMELIKDTFESEIKSVEKDIESNQGGGEA